MYQPPYDPKEGLLTNLPPADKGLLAQFVKPTASQTTSIINQAGKSLAQPQVQTQPDFTAYTNNWYPGGSNNYNDYLNNFGSVDGLRMKEYPTDDPAYMDFGLPNTFPALNPQTKTSPLGEYKTSTGRRYQVYSVDSELPQMETRVATHGQNGPDNTDDPRVSLGAFGEGMYRVENAPNSISNWASTTIPRVVVNYEDKGDYPANTDAATQKAYEDQLRKEVIGDFESRPESANYRRYVFNGLKNYAPIPPKTPPPAPPSAVGSNN